MDDGSGRTSAPQPEQESVAVPTVSDTGAARSDRSARSPNPAHVAAGSLAENDAGATPPLLFAVPGWAVLVTGLYGLISGVLLLQLLTGIVVIFRLSRAARPLRADWTAGARVRVSESVAMPVTFASTILLPADCQSWPALKQRAVMSHEISHIERHDFYWLLVAAFHRVVFWFNPHGGWCVGSAN
jgi:beta-lactamase regulating signal transducer with metallopeptidase domain